jgi:hypothetical protein
MIDKANEITSTEFEEILLRLAREEGVDLVMSIPGVYELVAEYLNNDVLDQWRAENDLEDNNVL